MKLSDRAESLLDTLLLMKIRIHRHGQDLDLRSTCFELDASIQREFADCKEELLAAYPTESDSTDCLIPLSGGEQPRIYVVHSAVGSVYGYRHMAKLLSPRLEVFGFSRAGGEMPASVDAMTEMYVKELLTHSSDEPFVLYGGSAGGLLAMEMARILEERGRPPALLVLVDVFDPQYTLLATEKDLTQTGWISLVDWHCHRGWLPQLTGSFWSKAENERLEWLASRRSEKLVASWNDVEDLTSIYQKFREFWIDMNGIQLQTINTPSIYFRATHTPLGYSESIRAAMGAGSNNLFEVEGHHLDLFRPAGAAGIARPLSEMISNLVIRG